MVLVSAYRLAVGAFTIFKIELYLYPTVIYVFFDIVIYPRIILIQVCANVERLDRP